MELLNKTGAPVELKVFEASIRILLRSPSKADAEQMVGHVVAQVFPGSTVTVADSDADAADARFVAIEGSFGREPLTVQKRSDLKKLAAPNNEMAIVLEENNTPYIARHEVPAGTAGLDLSKTLGSEHGWTWFELRYFQALQQAAMEAQQRAQQQQQNQQRPQPMPGQRPGGPRIPKLVR